MKDLMNDNLSYLKYIILFKKKWKQTLVKLQRELYQRFVTLYMISLYEPFNLNIKASE